MNQQYQSNHGYWQEKSKVAEADMSFWTHGVRNTFPWNTPSEGKIETPVYKEMMVHCWQVKVHMERYLRNAGRVPWSSRCKTEPCRIPACRVANHTKCYLIFREYLQQSSALYHKKQSRNVADRDRGEAVKEKAQLQVQYRHWTGWLTLPGWRQQTCSYETGNLFYCFLIRCWHYLPLIAFSFPLVIIPLHVCSEKLKMRQITEKELIVNE